MGQPSGGSNPLFRTIRPGTPSLQSVKAHARFDAGEDMTPYMDWEHARRPGREVQRVNVDFPVDLLRAIDREARRIGVTRQAFIKLRLADTLESH